MRVTIVIPTYNERNNILPLIQNIKKSFAQTEAELRLVIVDDNSPDRTADIIKDEIAQGEETIDLIERPGKMGLGSAYADAFRWILRNNHNNGDPEIIVQMDADLSHPPSLIIPMIEAIRTEGVDLAIASRYTANGGVADGWPLHRRITSKGANALARTILGIKCKDVTSGFRAYRRNLVERLMANRLSSKGYEFQVETLYIASKLTANIIEVPFLFKNRTKGESKLNLREIMRFLKTVITIRLMSNSLILTLSDHDHHLVNGQGQQITQKPS